MLNRAEKIDLATKGGASLTAREREIALLAMSGLRNKTIASELHLCEGTVKIHLHNIFRKLGVKSRTALLVRCS
jgi:DNA-binding CsgD family transcriptional regulator